MDITFPFDPADEPANYVDACINCVYQDGASCKVHVKLSLEGGEDVNIAFTEDEFFRLQEATETSAFKWIKAPRA